jgi:hypothetical protein
VAIGVVSHSAFAQTPAPPATQGSTPTPNKEVFGEEVTLIGKPSVFIAGKGTWDNAFPMLIEKFKAISAFLTKQKLKAAGSSMAIYLTANDQGFEFQVAAPLAEVLTNLPRGAVTAGQTPVGKALKFVHRGSYDSMELLYESINNYIDEKRFERQGPYVEEYVTDPLTTPQDKLVVNVYVLVK